MRIAKEKAQIKMLMDGKGLSGDDRENVVQRLKDEVISTRALEWNLSRSLSKINYRIHTDAIAEKLIPHQLEPGQASQIYANEADVLNMAIFSRQRNNGVKPIQLKKEICAIMRQ